MTFSERWQKYSSARDFSAKLVDFPLFVCGFLKKTQRSFGAKDISIALKLKKVNTSKRKKLSTFT